MELIQIQKRRRLMNWTVRGKSTKSSKGTQPNHPNSEKQKIDEMGCSRKSIGDVGVAVAEMARSTKSIGDVGVAVVADAHRKPMQAKGDNNAAQSSGKISRNFHIELL
jgi:hypothetical protein